MRVSYTVTDIFSVGYRRDLEIWLIARLSLLKTVPFERLRIRIP